MRHNRTVHRLILTVIIISLETTQNASLGDFYKDLEQLGISFLQLQQMVAWMKAALGEAGLFVSPFQMQEWRQIWESQFPVVKMRKANEVVRKIERKRRSKDVAVNEQCMFAP